MSDDAVKVSIAAGGIVLVFALLYGWVMNIVTLVHSDFVLSGMFIARCIGIFVAPVGSVLGYF